MQPHLCERVCPVPSLPAHQAGAVHPQGLVPRPKVAGSACPGVICSHHPLPRPSSLDTHIPRSQT